MNNQGSIGKMKEMMNLTSTADKEICQILLLFKELHVDNNTRYNQHEKAYSILMNNLNDYIKKVKNETIIDNKVLVNLLSDTTHLSSIIALTKEFEEIMNAIHQLEDAFKEHDLLTITIQKNEEESQQMGDYDNDDSESNESEQNRSESSGYYLNINHDEDESREGNNSSIKYHSIQKKKKNKRNDDDESYTLSRYEKSFEDDNVKEKKFYPIFTCRKRNRKPVTFCNNPVKMVKYDFLFNNPMINNNDLSLESSDYFFSFVTLTSEDKIEELKTERQALFPIVLNDIKPYATRYLYDNFNQLLHIRTIYFCCYDMRKTPPEYNYEYLSANTEIVNGMKDLKFIKLVLIRIQGGKIQNVILGCSNLFSSYIIRKDIEGHTMIKGELKVSYETFHFYFLTGIKGFSQLSQIQIEVYVHKYELYDDYNETIDKTNLKSDIIKKYVKIGKKLNKLRTIDQKIKFLSYQ